MLKDSDNVLVTDSLYHSFFIHQGERMKTLPLLLVVMLGLAACAPRQGEVKACGCDDEPPQSSSLLPDGSQIIGGQEYVSSGVQGCGDVQSGCSE